MDCSEERYSSFDFVERTSYLLNPTVIRNAELELTIIHEPSISESRYWDLTLPSWEEAKPEDLPTTSLLSLISFKLRPNTNLQDVSKAPGKLWKAAMDYIYTIPGSRSFEWGENMGNHDEIVVFVQWDTAQSWHRFETHSDWDLFSESLKQGSQIRR
jgi:hypothetical protein